jgi:hypothetical protein
MNQLKIEIGDTVRISEDSKYYKNGVNNPTCEGVYNKDDGGWSLAHRVDWANGMSEWYNLSDLTLIKKGKTMQFTKSDLKTGMFVKYRNGEYRMVLGNIITGDGWMSLNDLSSNLLENINGRNRLDVMSVYTAKHNATIASYLKGQDLTLIWERTEQTPAQKEMEVLQQQAKALQEQITKLQGKL